MFNTLWISRGTTVAAAAVDVASPTTTETTVPAAEGTQQFVWERNWWPVHVVSYMDPTRPTPVELLGRQLVLWQDAAGTWRCFRDSCPHRRVPLSEGRVEGGELVCSYHGWRFNEGGACTSIPQAPDAKSLVAATASPRSCVTSFPVKEAGGLLWVWPEESPAAAANAAAAALPLPNAMHAPHLQATMEEGWYMRELPYDYDILIENITDPSHLPFAHHKLVPSLDRKTAPPIPFAPLEDRLQPGDLDLLADGTPPICAYEFPNARVKENRVLFSAPSLVTYHSKTNGSVTVIYAMPSGPGRSRVFTTSSFKGQAYIPKWVPHMMLMKLFDGDSVFLNAQGNFLRAQEAQAGGQGPTWANEYFMPMTSDRAVVASRKWLDNVAGGGPVYPPDAAPATKQVTREQLLDRMGQHTKHCQHCRQGLEFAARLVAAAKALLAASFFALCCLAGSYGLLSLFAGGLPSVGTAVAVAGGLLAGWLHSKGLWLQQQFTFTDHVHADNH